MSHPIIMFYLALFLVFFHVGVMSDDIADHTQLKSIVHVGAILDENSPEGAIAETCMSMAISDFYALHPHHWTRLVLHPTTANDLGSTAAAVVDLVKNVKVHAILGPQIPDAAPLVVEMSAKAHVPVISFFPASPSLSHSKNPYFIRAAQDDSFQVKAIAATLQRFGRYEAVFVYQDTDLGNGMISSLVNALHEHDIRVAHMSAIPSSAGDFHISRELNMLMTRKNRVFVVHMTSSLGSRFFALADKAGMMSEGYAWLITTSLSNSLKAMDSEIVDSMEGVLGIRYHVPESKHLTSFNIRWKRNLHLMNPNSSVTEHSIFGLWAYDTIWALAMAVERIGDTDFASLGSSRNGLRLVKEILKVKFKGLSGEFHLVNGQLKSSALEIFNVIGKGERVVGYWSPDKKISRKLYSSASNNDLKNIIWPGDSTLIPVCSATSKLRIGIPVKVGFKEFVDHKKKKVYTNDDFSGFSIDVFRAVLEVFDFNNISYDCSKKKNISYEFVPFENEKGEMNGTYNDLLRQIEEKRYDAVVGDVTIVAERTYHVDFTLPYSESGVTMLVPVTHGKHIDMWIFLQPWSWDLWVAVIASFVFMGIVIRIMEHPTVNTAFAGSRNRQLGMTLWFPFSALAIPQRELVVKDGSWFVLVIWIGFAVILMQIYTASLSSMLTVDQLQPTFDSVNMLRTKGYKVGYQNCSFVKGFLKEQLNFTESQLIPYDTIEEYHNALTKGHKNGGVAAIFDEIPYIRVFLAKYVSHYMMAGPIYRTDGFGFAFPIRSPLVSTFSRAILKVREQGELMDKIEKKYFGHTITSLGVAPQISSDGPRQLHSSSLAGLFVIVGIATLLALGISESYIWSKPIALAKQLSTRYFSSHDQPTNATELVARSTPQVDSANENSHELEESVGNSESTISILITGENINDLQREEDTTQ